MLKASDLRTIQQEKKKQTREVYKKLLDVCYKYIKQQNEKGYTSVIYKLKLFTPNFPLYNINYAIAYMQHKLVKGGFRVPQMSMNSLYIDWSRA